MTINYIAVEFKPLYIPFDYSFPPCKEYIPPIPSPLQAIIAEIESALHLNACTPAMVQKLIQVLELEQDLPFELPEIVEDAKNLLDDLRDRAPELFKGETQ